MHLIWTQYGIKIIVTPSVFVYSMLCNVKKEEKKKKEDAGSHKINNIEIINIGIIIQKYKLIIYNYLK